MRSPSSGMGRARNLALNVATSLVSKFGTTAVQILALPLVAIALGTESFALFGVLLAMVAWLSIATLGVGPVVTVSVAGDLAAGHPEVAARRFSSAFFLVLASVAVLGGLCFAVAWLAPIDLLVGSNFTGRDQEIRVALGCLIGLGMMQGLLAVVEAAQAATQKMYVFNLMQATSSLVGLVLIYLFVLRGSLNLLTALLLFTLPQFVFRVVNAAVILVRERTFRPHPALWRRALVGQTLAGGAAYALAGSVGHFLSHVLPVILAARYLDGSAVAAVVAVMNMVLLMSGVSTMFAIPLWSAVAESRATGDRAWMVRAYRFTTPLSVGFCVLLAVSMWFAGDRIFDLWYRGEVPVDRDTAFFAAIYLGFSTWEVIHFQWLVAFGRTGAGAVIVLLRGLLATCMMIPALQTLGASAPFVVMIGATALVSVLPLYRRTATLIHSSRLPEEANPAPPFVASREV